MGAFALCAVLSMLLPRTAVEAEEALIESLTARTRPVRPKKERAVALTRADQNSRYEPMTVMFSTAGGSKRTSS